MMRLLLATTAAVVCCVSVAFAVDKYNDVAAEDQGQYLSCKTYSLKRWTGGEEASPIAGQTKAEAFCTCLWNETPNDFRGGLARFSESDAGAPINKICEKYSNWNS